MSIDEAIRTLDDHEARIKEVPIDSGIRVADGDMLVVGDEPFRLDGPGFTRC